MKLTKGKLLKLFNKKKQTRKKNKYIKKNHKRNTHNNINKNINLANKTLKKIIVGGYPDTNIVYNSEDNDNNNSTNQNGFNSVNNMSNILSSYKE